MNILLLIIKTLPPKQSLHEPSPLCPPLPTVNSQFVCILPDLFLSFNTHMYIHRKCYCFLIFSNTNESESRSVVSDSLRSQGLYSPWNSPGQNPGVGSPSLLQGIFPTQWLNPDLPHCRRILLPAEPQGKPKNTGVGSLSLLQWIFLTQEQNWNLLHCRWILYQLSYEGSPNTNDHI